MNGYYQPEGARLHTRENEEYLATPTGLERAMNEGAIHIEIGFGALLCQSI